MFRLAIPMATALLTAGVPVAAAQDGTPPPPADAEEERNKVTPLERKEARALLYELRKELDHKEPRIRKEAIDRLAAHQSEEFVKPLVDFLKDKDPQVQEAAVHALGSQPFDKAQKALIKRLIHPRNEGKEEIALPVLEALGRCGWGKRGYQTLRDLFDECPKKIKRGIFKAFTAQKDIQAFSLFVDHLDEPRPGSPNSPSNPPASYWKARWEEWTYLKTYARKGLKALTGQEFENAAAAKEWADTKEARKAGFVYQSGA